LALANCKDCGRVVSDRARLCVHCGGPLPMTKGTIAAIVILMAATVLGVAFAAHIGALRRAEANLLNEVREHAAPDVRHRLGGWIFTGNGCVRICESCKHLFKAGDPNKELPCPWLGSKRN